VISFAFPHGPRIETGAWTAGRCGSGRSQAVRTARTSNRPRTCRRSRIAMMSWERMVTSWRAAALIPGAESQCKIRNANT